MDNLLDLTVNTDAYSRARDNSGVLYDLVNLLEGRVTLTSEEACHVICQLARQVQKLSEEAGH